jgi:hypothetical protein
MLGAQSIALGHQQVVLTGGMERLVKVVFGRDLDFLSKLALILYL